MRAIYRAVCNGRQVGLLAPTTVLAAQHLRVVRLGCTAALLHARIGIFFC